MSVLGRTHRHTRVLSVVSTTLPSYTTIPDVIALRLTPVHLGDRGHYQCAHGQMMAQIMMPKQPNRT
jgi:hypothetical protein